MLHFIYKPLLSVSLMHNYYFNGVSEDFHFQPLEETIETLNTFGLRQRNVNGRLVVYQQLDHAALPFTPIDQAIDLFFTVKAKTDILNVTSQFGSGSYWFSNLKEDGSFKSQLTVNAVLSAADTLATRLPETFSLDFLPAVYSGISLKKIRPGEGWKTVASFGVDVKANSQLINVQHPGLYQIEKTLTAGGTEVSTVFLSNEVFTASVYWGVLHLQLKPGDVNTDYLITLAPRLEIWQYLFIEPNGTAPINVNEIDLEVSTMNTRYPAGIQLDLKLPAAYSPSLKELVENLKSGGKVRDVFVFESNQHLEILDGKQPQVELQLNNTTLAEHIATPSRAMKDKKIIFNIKK